MIWHIFRKDWQLMWKSIVAVACIEIAFTAVQIRQTLYGGNPVLGQLSQVLMWLWLMSSCILIITIVHQDALYTSNQDWLTRPISRWDVLVEKTLLAFAMVQGVSILSDAVQGMVYGFPFSLTVSATLARAAVVFIAIILPSLALGAVTRSVTEATVLVVVAAFGVFAFTMIAIGLAGGYGHQFDPTGMTGEEWLPNLARFLLFLAGIGAILIWQYRTRETRRARIAMAVVLVVCLVSQLTPWKPVFLVQERLSPEPGAAHTIAMVWPATKDRTDRAKLVERAPPAPRTAGIVLPVSVSGMPSNSVLKADKSEFTFSDSEGHPLVEGTGGDIEVRNEDGAGDHRWYDQVVEMPPRDVQLVENHEVRASIKYFMTLFKLGASYSLRALNDDRRLPGWGWCRSTINGEDTGIEVNCIQMGRGPTCATVFLEHIPTGLRNPDNTACYPNYAPFSDRPIPDAFSRFRLVLPFRDPAGLTKYPVDASRLASSAVIIRMYVPQDHFTREVTSPLFSMRDLRKN